MNEQPPAAPGSGHRPIDRRGFLGVIVGAFLTACTSDGSGPADTTPSTTSTSQANESTAAPSTTSPPPSSSTTAESERATIEPLDAPAVDVPPDAFALGVASGEPDASSVVLWTRLVGDLPDTFEMVWEVAMDAEFTELEATNLVTVSVSDAHSVRVIADGLPADQTLAYRFRAGTVTSPVGITNTMPAAGDPRPITLGVSSCQARTDGAWAAHRSLATAEVDLVVWLGDAIYGEYESLDDYRSAYTEYRSDPLLQASRSAHPWVSFIDDHEVANDFDASIDPARRGAALRAWWEHQPTRLPPPGPDGSLRIHRAFDVGGAIRIIGLDVRQYANADSLYGNEQWSYIEQAVQHSATSTVIASPVLMSGLRDLQGEPLVGYSIDARPSERVRMAEVLATAPNPVIVSGDLHTSLVADFSADPLDASAAPVAVEIMAPAISSAFPARFAPLAPLLPLVNPQLRQVEVANGWLELTVGAGRVAGAFHFVDDIQDPSSSITIQPIPEL